MKKLLSIFALVLTSQAVSAQDGVTIAAADPNAPIISFEQPTIEFGSVPQYSEQVRTFTFTNTGKSPLVITNIKGQCGCTTILPDSWPKEPIAPGATATFKVKYDTSTRVGMFEKKILVYCNAANASNGVVEVKIKGNVVPAAAGGAPGN